jgi:hypothetical protein
MSQGSGIRKTRLFSPRAEEAKLGNSGSIERGVVMTNIVWKCEQWFGGQLQEQKMFFSEEQAREFAKKLAGVAPDLVLKIEPMPVEHVWN